MLTIHPKRPLSKVEAALGANNRDREVHGETFSEKMGKG